MMGWVRRSELDRAKADAYSAYDRLDAVLSENEVLTKLLADERERNEMMAVCVIDTLREALGMEQPQAEKPAVDTSIKYAAVLPTEIEAAINSTFPDDSVIRSANIKYAYSQQHRWDDYPLEVAEEIKQGERV